MSTARATCLGVMWLAVMSAGCGAATHAPRPRLVAPAQGSSAAPVDIVIAGEHFEPSLHIDFTDATKTVLANDFTATLGDVTLGDVRLAADGTLHATVPSGVPRGVFSLTVTDGRGQRGVLEQAYEVVAHSGDVASVEFEPISSQVAGVPFAVSLEARDALGQRVERFAGIVELSMAGGTVEPSLTPTFHLGRVGPLLVSVTAVGQAQRLEARVMGVSVGQSAPFEVAPSPGVSLAFESAPQSVIAGRCSSPVVVRVLNAQGVAVPVDSRVTFEAPASSGFGVFSDASCSQQIADAPVLSSGATTQVYFRATVAGALEVTARVVGLRSVSQTLTVTSASPHAVEFVAEPGALRAGACASPLELQLVDAFGNLSPASEAFDVSLSAAPTASFFSDTACMAPGSTRGWPVGASALTFAVLPGSGNQAVTLSVSASVSSIAGATRSLWVLP